MISQWYTRQYTSHFIASSLSSSSLLLKYYMYTPTFSTSMNHHYQYQYQCNFSSSSTTTPSTSRTKTNTNKHDNMKKFENISTCELNFSALLDPGLHNRSVFRQGMHRTKDGTLAAKYLIQERRALVKVLRDDGFVCRTPVSPPYNSKYTIHVDASEQLSSIQSSNKRNRRRKRMDIVKSSVVANKSKPFTLVGHGVPVQLLRDHLQLCHDILHQYDAVHCSFANFFGECGAESVEWIHIRNGEGKNVAFGWPPDQLHKSLISNEKHSSSLHVDDRLDLYLTVMDRISRKIFWLLHLDSSPIKNVRVRNWNARFQIVDDTKDRYKSNVSSEETKVKVEIIERSGTFLIRTKLENKSINAASMAYEAYFTIPI